MRLKGSFTIAGVAIDPTVTALNILDPNRVLTTLIYGGAGIVREAAGVYHYDLFVGTPGDWYYQWVGTGAAQAASEASFSMELSRFP